MSDTHPEPSEHEIAVCAYCTWEQDGRPEGRALDYWLRAERHLTAASPDEEAIASDSRPAGSATSDWKESGERAAQA